MLPSEHSCMMSEVVDRGLFYVYNSTNHLTCSTSAQREEWYESRTAPLVGTRWDMLVALCWVYPNCLSLWLVSDWSFIFEQNPMGLAPIADCTACAGYRCLVIPACEHPY